MTSSETIAVAGEALSPAPPSKKNRLVAFLALAGVGIIGAIVGVKGFGNNTLGEGITPAERPRGLLELCQYLLKDPEVNAAFTEKIPGIRVSPNACKYHTDPKEFAYAAWMDLSVNAEIDLTITERLGNYDGFDEVATIPGTESTLQNRGTVIMNFPDYSISVGYNALKKDGVSQTAYSLAGVVAANTVSI